MSQPPVRARNWGPPGFRYACITASFLFLSVMALDRFEPGLAFSRVPEPVLYFAQMTGLFPYADHNVTDYRAEAWLCGEHRFVAADETPFFPILAGTKESRFHRTLYFYRGHRPTLHALDAYLTERLAQSPAFAGKPIGGVRFVEVLEPIPTPGSKVTRFTRKPLGEYPEKSVRLLYHTPPEIRAIRCREP